MPLFSGSDSGAVFGGTIRGKQTPNPDSGGQAPGPPSGFWRGGGAERMSRIACFSSWDHAGRRSRRGRREFGPSRPSSWSFCQWDRVRRETPTILAAASADTSCRRVPTTGSARTGGLPHRGEDSISPGTPPGSPARICRTRAVEPDGTGGMVSSGVLSPYRFGYPQNENFYAIWEGQFVPASASKRTCKAHQEC